MAFKVPAPNLLDRAVGFFDPVRAARRMHARTAMAVAESYTSTNSTSGTRYYRPGARSAAADQSGVLSTLRGQSRDLARNHPVGGGAINTNVDRAVGTGLALSAQPDATVLGWTTDELNAWKATTQAEFSMWADSKACDLTEVQNFYELQGLVLRAALESGDCFANLPDAEATTWDMPYRLRIQVLEADRVGNPKGQADNDGQAGGIRFNEQGRPLAAHVYKRHPGGLYTKGGGDRFAGDWFDFKGEATGRRKLLHLYRRLRPEQPRGIPYLAPVIDAIKQLGRYTEAEITAAVVSSMFTAFVKTKDGDAAPIFDGAVAAGAAQPGDIKGGRRPDEGEVELGHGAVVSLYDDESVEFANPSRPNTGFEPFVDSVAKLIGVGLNLPVEVLMKRFNGSYSASRAALLDAWQWLRSVRNWLAINFCQPVYETWLAEAVAIGRIVAPGFFDDPKLRWAYTRAGWHGDSMGSLNPKDEVAAYRDAIDGNLATHEQAEWALFGTDWNTTLATKKAEAAAMKKAGLVSVPRAGAAAQPRAGDAKPDGDQPKRDGDDDEQQAD